MSNFKTILLVEDNPDDLMLTLRALRTHHIANKIVEAHDGVEALDYLFGTGAHAGRDLRDQPQLILLDLKLAKVDGLEVLRRIRSDPRTKLVPVVILTSSDEGRDIANGYALGANSFVPKPFDLDAFKTAIEWIENYWLGLSIT